MEKLIRYRKAFYQKQNDLKYGNKKQQIAQNPIYKYSPTNKLYQSLSISLRHASHNENTKVKPIHITSNTEAYLKQYGQEHLQSDEYLNKPSDFLRDHEINEIFRARMLDWMVQVISSYKFNHKTYFDSVNLMDRYFGASKEFIPSSKLHIIGVQCMMIASKMQEVYPLKIKTVYEKIAHKKLPLNQLIQTEQSIIKTLQYKLNTWSFYDLIMLKISSIMSQNKQKRQELRAYNTNTLVKKSNLQSNQEILKKLQQISSYLSKFAIFNYDFYQQTTAILLAQTIVKATLQIMQLNDGQHYTSTPILIELSKQKLFSLIKKHKSKFTGLNNIYKFTSKEIISLVDQFL